VKAASEWDREQRHQLHRPLLSTTGSETGMVIAGC
jgi:hypothetical protein